MALMGMAILLFVLSAYAAAIGDEPLRWFLVSVGVAAGLWGVYMEVSDLRRHR